MSIENNTVFLSYSTQDRDFVETMKGELERILSPESQPAAQPFKILDIQSDIPAGVDIRQSIKDAMQAADTVVFFSSPHAERSQWVNYEAGLADAMGKDLVIVGRKGTEKSPLFERFKDNAKFIELAG